MVSGAFLPHNFVLHLIFLYREFSAAATSNPGSAELALSKIPKLVTVVNILSHLGTTHPTQLEEAVQEALQVTSLHKEKVADG